MAHDVDGFENTPLSCLSCPRAEHREPFSTQTYQMPPLSENMNAYALPVIIKYMWYLSHIETVALMRHFAAVVCTLSC